MGDKPGQNRPAILPDRQNRRDGEPSREQGRRDGAAAQRSKPSGTMIYTVDKGANLVPAWWRRWTRS
jgi:hypothetical protein